MVVADFAEKQLREFPWVAGDEIRNPLMAPPNSAIDHLGLVNSSRVWGFPPGPEG